MAIIKPYIRRQIYIAACVDVAHVLIGFTLAWSAPSIPKLQDPKQTPLNDVITVSQASWLASTAIYGGLIGPYIAGPISNRIGRKYSLMIAELILIGATFLLTFANSYQMLIAARFITGMCTGMITVTDLVYIGEIASPNIRGMLLTSTGVFHSLGVLFMYSVGSFASYKMLGVISILLSLIHLLGCIFLPESQMYYAIKGRKQEARTTLYNLRKSTDVEIELENMMETIQNEKKTTSYREIFTMKCNRKAFFIVVALCLLQECSGVLAILHFSTTIFQFAQSSIDPDIATIVVGVTQFGATLLAPSLVDKLGRRTLLLFSTGVCAACMALLGIYFYLSGHNKNLTSSVGWLPLVLVVVFYCGFGSGLGIIPNTLVGEMFNARIRTRGSALTVTIGWAAGVITISSFGYVVEALGSYVMFIMFAFINCLGFIFSYYMVPETKGMTLVEIEKMLAR